MSNLEMKVDALMRHCTAETEESRAEAMATCRALLNNSTVADSTVKAGGVEATIRRVLLELGMPDKLLGHQYLVTALTIATKNHFAAHSITGDLYPTIAEKYCTTWTRVERAIRLAIESTWDRGDMEVLAKYFGNSVNSRKGKPTNGEFIARIANVVRAQI